MHTRLARKTYGEVVDDEDGTVKSLMWLDGVLDVDADCDDMSNRVAKLGDAKALELFADYCDRLKTMGTWISYLDVLALAFSLGVVVVLVSRMRTKQVRTNKLFPTSDGKCEMQILGSDEERATFGFVPLGEDANVLHLAYDKDKKHFASLFSLDDLKKGLPDLTSRFQCALECSPLLFRNPFRAVVDVDEEEDDEERAVASAAVGELIHEVAPADGEVTFMAAAAHAEVADSRRLLAPSPPPRPAK
jgi:hypothetical protein